MFRKEFLLRHYPFCIFVLAFLLSLILALFTVMPESDIARYGSIVISFTEGDWAMVFHPRISPLVPLIAGVVAWVTGAGAFFALQLVSTLFFALQIFPLYGIFRNCFSAPVARTALLMSAFASIPLRYGASGLRDSAKGFFFILCVYLLVEIYRKRTDLKNYLFLGAAISLLALTRTEAPVYSGLFGLTVLCMEMISRCRLRFPWRSCLCGAVALLLISPWLIYMFQITGYFVPEIRYVALIQRVLPADPPKRNMPATQEVPAAQPSDNKGRGGITSTQSASAAPTFSEKHSAPTTSAPTAVHSIPTGPELEQKRLHGMASALPEINATDTYDGIYKEFFSGLIGGFFPPLGILALLGIALRFHKREWTPIETILLISLLLHALLLVIQIRISDNHFYISRRYLITVVALEFGWSAYGAIWIYQTLASRLKFLLDHRVIVLLYLIPCIGLYLYAFQRTIKTYTSRSKSSERIALFTISDYIRSDYHGPKTFLREKRSDQEFQTNRLPAVLSEFPQLGFLSGGQTISLADPLFAEGKLTPDYIVCRPGRFSAETLEKMGYLFRRSFRAGKNQYELFVRRQK